MNFIRQKDGYGCGPTALYNLLLFNNVKKPNLDRLYKLCNTDRHGTAKKDIQKAFKELNLDMVEGKSRSNKCELSASFIHKQYLCGIIGYYVGKEGHYIMFFRNDHHIFITNSLVDSDLNKKSYKEHKKLLIVGLDWWIDKSTRSDTEIYYFRRMK